MTGWDLVTIDRTTLPEALVALAKSQSRITTTLDDAYVTELLGQAIDDVERLANSNLFDATYTATVDPQIWCPWWCPAPGFTWNTADQVAVTLPVNNVRSFTAVDADSNDLSASYSITQTEPGGVGRTLLWGPLPQAGASTITFTFTCGVTDPADLVPSVRRGILRRFAALYENREAPLDITDPDSVGLWRPAV
jgi:hypothetical protein